MRSLARYVAPAAVGVLALAWPLLRGIDHRFISFSDGAYTYIASAVASHGPHALFRSIVFSQPPGAVLAAALLWRLSPHVETLRAALAVIGALTAFLTFALARTNRLSPTAAATAALVALTAPIHAQFSGLDGEAVLAPLVLSLALALERRRLALAGALVGAGFFFKLTWGLFALAGLLLAARAEGTRGLARASLAAGGVAGALFGASIAAFGWSPGDLLSEIVLAQSGSGLQLKLLADIAAVVFLLWWPLLAPATVGLRSLGDPTRVLLVAGLLAGAFTVKQGTFFNVLDPAEPLLAVAAVAGALALWRHPRASVRGLVALCAAGLLVHTASLGASRIGRAIPFPAGAAFVDTDDERLVDRAAGEIDAHSQPGDAVLVNPLLALVAGRREVADQADWFILHALERSCGERRTGRCGLWSRIKAEARSGRVPVVSVDSNVVSFDPSFRADVGVRSMRRVLRVKQPPIDLRLYARR